MECVNSQGISLFSAFLPWIESIRLYEMYFNALLISIENLNIPKIERDKNSNRQGLRTGENCWKHKMGCIFAALFLVLFCTSDPIKCSECLKLKLGSYYGSKMVLQSGARG